MPRKDAYTGPISAQQQQDLVSEGIENFELPKNVVLKIAKSAIPESAKLQKDTVLSLVKGSTVFINYLAATAHDVAHSKQHKSISASDVLKALELIEFGDLVDKLQGELTVYREQAKTKKGASGSTTTITIPSISASASASSGPTTNAKKPTTTTTSIISSISTAGKASTKGKEKAGTIGLPPPFTNVPLGSGPSASFAGAESSILGMGVPMNVDDDEGGVVGVGGEVVDEEVVDEEGEEGVDEEIVDDDEDEDEGEGELEDRMAVEEQEVLKDSRGLDDHSIVADHDI
ncbi:uncharacterized protein LACBIDRAFT_309497 [Laccaria bicolor S238N-H82]|uniref:DNA polymerase epsilon subunit D n=1 Tax=Laccaria bicolor (strain S238N-H82 / ATCC MYA-4686) TaxID=486041 RepID=B0DSG2_LACBS|nr:uncharacterized protein LACBIDRAFT_309497 [Laccaria bicolor S238N-H82]EDR02540.1 predicted protein [Laccaria bicolor S238N-H82]|eukprot:XP_001886903.1 predicted protein [Laccaria bicolor S238N-H82]